MEKQLGLSLSKEIREQIQQATSYQQMVKLRNNAIQKHLEQNLGNKEQTVEENELNISEKNLPVAKKKFRLIQAKITRPVMANFKSS
ncbi:hypothetical protein [endosymbiont GvMRE of Glomus versiforme]|uniref:hypothetical protein n=1 Tax=endosymbiont GvMRE of Glomus versiforme TaxID=2039283 RepID=UPI000ED175D9|nr:hypothetical protein [endosymbiont GvMRE of Glomus versiforme]RHZ36080.1 hypothetical protein GvMRE_Ic3g99 [endosymbiont GvMRE of Glomus versiforme]